MSNRPYSPTRRPVGARVHLAIFALAAIPLTLGLGGIGLGLGMRDWPSAEARILDGSLTVSKSPSDRYDRKASPSASWRVRYEYSVGSDRYEGTGIERGAFGMINSAAAREFARQYRSGTATQVWVNPVAPWEAYLVNGISGPAKFLTGIGVALVLFGMLARRVTRAAPAAPAEPRPRATA